MEKFTKPELLSFLCDLVGDADNQFMNSPLSGNNEPTNDSNL